ncbi:hypothetical protein [Geminicoccus roseus]|uniref:hypothetical protein n=1 Tax=Geminicoccus roseus TaxID=404900 RepID=UPI0003FA7396|nr:hypothetical protein [Geminicoccus roseus]
MVRLRGAAVAAAAMLACALLAAAPAPAHAAVDLGNVVIQPSGWRYNLVIMRAAGQTNTYKAEQYLSYLTKYNLTDEWVVAYAAAVAAQYGTAPASGPTPSPLPSDPSIDPILGNTEILKSGWRYQLTVLKEQGKYSAAKQAEYEYYRDRNNVTDAYVDAYAKAVAAKFPEDAVTAPPPEKKAAFKIFRGFRYTGMPSSFAYCGMSEYMRILYDTELFPGNSKEMPDVAHLQNKIVPTLLKENKQYVVIDIEHWDPILEMDKLITVVRTLKQGVRAAGNTRMKFGFYMLLPIRDFLAPTKKASQPERWERWMAQNEQMRRLAAEVDVVFPSLYTVSENRADWVTFANANIAEARKYGKPVIPFIWPQYHDTMLGLGTTYMPVNYWELQLNTIYPLSDGIAIWGSVKKGGGWDAWDGSRDWWAFAKNFSSRYSSVAVTSACKA